MLDSFEFWELRAYLARADQLYEASGFDPEVRRRARAYILRRWPVFEGAVIKERP